MGDAHVIWITGLSSAGKSTVAALVREELERDGAASVLLDGDSMRQILPSRYGHTPSDRHRLGRFYVDLAALIRDHGVNAIVATISLVADVHVYRRAALGDHCLDVVLDVPWESLQRRDTRGVYADHDENIVGAGQRAEFPDGALHIDNDDGQDPSAIAETIVNHLRTGGALGASPVTNNPTHDW